MNETDRYTRALSSLTGSATAVGIRIPLVREEFLSKDYRRQRKLDISPRILTLFQKNAAEH